MNIYIYINRERERERGGRIGLRQWNWGIRGYLVALKYHLQVDNGGGGGGGGGGGVKSDVYITDSFLNMFGADELNQ